MEEWRKEEKVYAGCSGVTRTADDNHADMRHNSVFLFQRLKIIVISGARFENVGWSYGKEADKKGSKKGSKDTI